MTTLHHLAELVLRTLDQQQSYFKSRSSDDLILSKGMERDLRKAAQSVLNNQSVLDNQSVLNNKEIANEHPAINPSDSRTIG